MNRVSKKNGGIRNNYRLPNISDGLVAPSESQGDTQQTKRCSTNTDDTNSKNGDTSKRVTVASASSTQKTMQVVTQAASEAESGN